MIDFESIFDFPFGPELKLGPKIGKVAVLDQFCLLWADELIAS